MTVLGAWAIAKEVRMDKRSNSREILWIKSIKLFERMEWESEGRNWGMKCPRDDETHTLLSDGFFNAWVPTTGLPASAPFPMLQTLDFLCGLSDLIGCLSPSWACSPHERCLMWPLLSSQASPATAPSFGLAVALHQHTKDSQAPKQEPVAPPFLSGSMCSCLCLHTSPSQHFFFTPFQVSRATNRGRLSVVTQMCVHYEWVQQKRI